MEKTEKYTREITQAMNFLADAVDYAREDEVPERLINDAVAEIRKRTAEQTSSITMCHVEELTRSFGSADRAIRRDPARKFACKMWGRMRESFLQKWNRQFNVNVKNGLAHTDTTYTDWLVAL